MSYSSQLVVEDLDSITITPGKVLIKPISDNDYIKISDEKGEIKVWIDGSYEPEKHAITYGEVVLASEINEDYSKSELKKGDIIFFHYLCCMNAIADQKYIIHCNQLYYIVNTESVFVAKRDEQVIPLNGTVLVEAIDDSLPEKNEWGMEIPKAKRNKNHLNEGIVINAGNPLVGEEKTCNEGDRIFWRTGASVPLQYSLFQTFSTKLVYQLKYEFVMGVRK